MEIRRIQKRIVKARRRIAKGSVLRTEKRGQVDEQALKERLEARLKELEAVQPS